MGQPVVHFSIAGKDGTKLQDYYADLFGWEIDAGNPMKYGLVQRESNAEGAGIPGGIGGVQEGAEPSIVIYVEVPDVEAGLARAESLGGKRLWGPDEVPGMGIVLGHFTDPEGNEFGLVQGPAA
jgi:predicted enzyme related to lactoylglutathione lyase